MVNNHVSVTSLSQQFSPLVRYSPSFISSCCNQWTTQCQTQTGEMAMRSKVTQECDHHVTFSPLPPLPGAPPPPSCQGVNLRFHLFPPPASTTFPARNYNLPSLPPPPGAKNSTPLGRGGGGGGYSQFIMFDQCVHADLG